MRFLKLLLSLLTAAALLSPIPSDARTSRMMSVQTPSGKTVQLRTMRVRGETMILVPMSTACDVFHVHC